MPSKEELTATINTVADEIRSLKAAMAPTEQVMAKVAELKALKANYETEVGEPFDPPKEDSKKKDKAAAAATSKEDKGPSKNDLKKAAKAAAKDAKRADHKAAAAAGGESGSATTAPAAGAAAAPASGSKSAVTTPAAAAGGGASSAADLLAGAVLHCCASTGLVACAALSGAPADLRKKVTVNATAPAAQLARLVVAGGSAQVVGDHAIARLILAASGKSLAPTPLGAAQADSMLDLASMFCADELPLQEQVTSALAASGGPFLLGSAASLADVAMVACFTAPGAPKTFPSAISKWLKSASTCAMIKEAKNAMSGKGGGGGKDSSSSGGDSGKSNTGGADEMSSGCPPLEDAVEGQVVTRFPPEPSGFLHIGHAKAVLLNEYYAKRYKGKMLLRFDDTNPSKEKEEFESNILRDLASLNVKPDAISHSSDHFAACQDYARTLLRNGQAFMDNTPMEQMREERSNRVESKHRNQSPEEGLALFERLVKGDPSVMEYCLRAKIDMASDNGTLRDPVLYRGNTTPHHRTGTKFHAYPTYDFVCPIVDSIEGVTHCLRTTEYTDRDFQYHILQDMLKLRKVTIYAFSKLNFVNTVLSKRKLQWFVDNGKVPDWNDPRFPTVQGVVRRGVTMGALRRFIYAQGASRNIVLQEWDKFWSMNKDEYEPSAPRFMGVATKNAVKLSLSGGDTETLTTDTLAAVSVSLVPSDPNSEPRPMRIGGAVYLEGEDASCCAVGDKVILVMWGVVEITAIEKDASGAVTSMSGVRQPEASVKKIKHKFNWVAATDDVLNGTVVEYDHLVTKPKLEEGENFVDFLNPLSVGTMPVLLEPAIRFLKEGEIIQLVRRGFFRVDKPASGDEGPHLVLIPDGKAKSMSTLSTALPHH